MIATRILLIGLLALALVFTVATAQGFFGGGRGIGGRPVLGGGGRGGGRPFKVGGGRGGGRLLRRVGGRGGRG